MGKKQKANALGRSLIKDTKSSSRGKRTTDSVLHTSELGDGYDWARLNLVSVTEQDSLQEFLSTAELAGTDFQAEKLNIQFVNPRCGAGLLTKDEKSKLKEVHHEKRDLLKIPRRPHWDPNMSAEELHLIERESFLEWRRSLAKLQEEDGLLMSPYEKNLDFWRQLWRVVEKSDIVVQILDARNPLLYHCKDLDKYVKEVDKKKRCLLLLNKSDFLTAEQRQSWANYFDTQFIQVAFFSAKNEGLEVINETKEESLTEDVHDIVDADKSKVVASNDDEDDDYETESEEEVDNETAERFLNKAKNSSELLNREALLELFKQIGTESGIDNIVTVGLVGYPNVGKSSTINALLQDKKTSVSNTPGKTKHFQTLFIDSQLMLCDCPGLVMPSFVFSKADLVINGILPIDQMRDHVPPVNLVCSFIPRDVLEDMYSVMIPRPLEGEDQDRSPTSEEFLNAYGFSRGFMTQNGQPDNPRASRYILKDYVNGRLLYCHAPPGVSQAEFHKFPPKRREAPPPASRQAQLALKPVGVTVDGLDKQFFKQTNKGYHVKGSIGVPSSNSSVNRSVSGSTASLAANPDDKKPWKNHKEKRNKKEKLRRVYRYLDE